MLLAALSLPAADGATAAAPTPPVHLTAPPAEATTLDNGLATLILADGSGTERPKRNDYAKIRVTVWQSDGDLVQHVEPPKSVTIQLANMLPGWRMAVEQMVEGERLRAWVPSSLGSGRIAAGESFVIDTELLEIIRPHVAPSDVAEPSAGATVTKSGLAYVVLQPGTGGARPGPRSHVTVHYTGWTSDGKMFDSSILRGEPASFPLEGVIRGWTEGLQLMTVGEKTRFWIPAPLAYGRDRTKPQGMLVFDIELLGFD